VAMIYAKPPHAIYVLKSSGITSPKDLEGRKIADTAFSAMPKMFDAYAKAANIDAGKVTWVVAAGDALPGMLALERVDGIGQFTVGELLLKKAAGNKELVRLAYGDVGLDYYSNGIITTDEMIRSKPDLVKRFVAATLRGLKDSIANPTEAANILRKQHRQIDADVAIAETEAVGALATVPNQPLGAFNPASVRHTVEIIGGAYPLKTPVKPEDIYTPVFVAQ
jgi:NitT/TauT family transport system substrate-binding protein